MNKLACINCFSLVLRPAKAVPINIHMSNLLFNTKNPVKFENIENSAYI